jgi:hypothetical protein
MKLYEIVVENYVSTAIMSALFFTSFTRAQKYLSTQKKPYAVHSAKSRFVICDL